MDNQIQKIYKKFTDELSECKDLSSINVINIKYLGRKGEINKLFTLLKSQSKTQIKDSGKKINQLKNKLVLQIKQKSHQLSRTLQTNYFTDPTLPGKSYPVGSIHIINTTIDQIASIFSKIGFIHVSYPEVEWDFFAFESLNMPADHPARDDFETCWIDAPKDKKMGKMVLTPHTSSGQVREMWRVKNPPIRMINISKCYRPNWDSTHTPMFFQFEGLCIDKNINITNLKGSIDYFVKNFFDENRQIRLRPFHFQFTEPSFEVDISCEICQGSGFINNQKCKVCKSGWLELGGTGMVHPQVLKYGEIDADKYQGWAFGFGIERVIMMKYKIDDIRHFYNNDLRFLQQF